MFTPVKPNTLLLACIIILGLLAAIQYYLVRKTYELTQEQYSREIKTAANHILNNKTGLEKSVLQSFTAMISLVAEGKVDQQQFLRLTSFKIDSVTQRLSQSYNRAFTKDPRLSHVAYLSNYDELSIEIKGTRHVLIFAQHKQSDSGKTALGRNNTLLPVRTFQGSFDGKSLGLGTADPKLSSIKLRFKGRQYADVSGWNHELLKRMTGVFLLAGSLLLAVSTLFYLMFRAILQQKKIADIQTDFTNNITHELKTPLSSTSVILKSLLKKEVLTKPEVLADLVASLSRQHQRIQHIVDTVLESALVTNHKPEKTKLDIKPYIAAYSKDLKLAAHTLNVLIDPIPKHVYVYLPSLEKALNNLVDNAVKYSADGTIISLKTYSDGHFYMITISDQGPGIASIHQEQIFKKFCRIPEQNRHTVKGLGLGLYISREAIEQLGGSLTLTSKQGYGSTFTIKLPLYEG
ncbi:MAG: HAMP domain-containing histidine kinase [Flavobacteriales bacterium]|nr:MAG: HAMP domain-containing histidine kinase [Flavobacteriales bacterium]